MNYDKTIWFLFKTDRADFNRFDRKVELLLRELYDKGRKQGAIDEKRRLVNLLKSK